MAWSSALGGRIEEVLQSHHFISFEPWKPR